MERMLPVYKARNAHDVDHYEVHKQCRNVGIKYQVVVSAHAIVQPGAVMVKIVNAFVADKAVARVLGV